MDALKSKIRHVPDFPKAGILFYDVTTLLRDAEGFKIAIDSLTNPYLDRGISLVVGIESRGFILGAAVADRLGAGFVPVRKVGKLPSLVEQTVQSFGRLDALVNNASTFYATTIGEIEVEQWNDLIGTNLQAPLFLSQAAAPALRKTQGAIVNITDIHADRPLKSYVVYSVAKAGLVGLTRSLARELAPEVRVNAVAPGPILWPDEDVFDELARQRIISHTPLKREGTPDDVAKAVHYLLADAPYVTGETISVDGGRHMAL